MLLLDYFKHFFIIIICAREKQDLTGKRPECCSAAAIV